jgi:ion channel
MLGQLLIGTLIISLTVVIAAVFAGVATWALQRAGPWLVAPPHGWKFITALGLTVLWIQAAVTICVWIWALLFLWLGLFPGLEPALYFAIVSFTTLGFGDVLLPVEWRLLSGLSAANGLLTFGFVTAFLVEIMRRIRREQTLGRPERP